MQFLRANKYSLLLKFGIQREVTEVFFDEFNLSICCPTMWDSTETYTKTQLKLNQNLTKTWLELNKDQTNT
jgi:hypothetical protein